MRNLFLILIVLVLVAILAIATGLVNVNQTQPARAPSVTADGATVTAQPGQAPRFEVEVAKPKLVIEKEPRTINVPTVRVTTDPAPPPANSAAPQQ